MAASLRMHTVTSPQVLRLLERQRSKTQYQKDLARFAPGGRGLTPRPFPDMEAARHGLLYEKEAITRFEQITGIPVLDVGHVIHERFEWLSCVPDGITVDGRVAEIKCPYYRPIVPGVPYQYIKQLQIAMEVTDLDEAILVQYKPASVFGEEQIMISTLARDRTWIRRNWSRLNKRTRLCAFPLRSGTRPNFAHPNKDVWLPMHPPAKSPPDGVIWSTVPQESPSTPRFSRPSTSALERP